MTVWKQVGIVMVVCTLGVHSHYSAALAASYTPRASNSGGRAG